MFRRIIVFALVAAGVLAATAGPAGAHVTVSADGAEPGAFATITFRVPNEQSSADTVGLKIQMPADHPIASVSVQPKPGWNAESTTTELDTPIEAHGDSITEAVSEVEWTGGKVPPGGFDEFRIQAGPLPEGVHELTFKAIQTYADADGQTEEVAWIQQSTADDPEPEHPAPVLEITSDGTDTAATDTAPSDDDAVTATASDDTDDDGGASTSFVVAAMAFGASGLAVGIIALVLGVAARHKVGLIARQAGIGEDET